MVIGRVKAFGVFEKRRRVGRGGHVRMRVGRRSSMPSECITSTPTLHLYVCRTCGIEGSMPRMWLERALLECRRAMRTAGLSLHGWACEQVWRSGGMVCRGHWIEVEG